MFSSTVMMFWYFIDKLETTCITAQQLVNYIKKRKTNKLETLKNFKVNLFQGSSSIEHNIIISKFSALDSINLIIFWISSN